MIHLYAEHLLNIRTLSIQAALSTVSNRETRATLSADGSLLTLTHENETASIKLPINLSPNKESNVTLTIPPVPSKTLTFRISLEEKEDVDRSVLSEDRNEQGNVIPWTASSLTAETEICCLHCQIVLVKRGQISIWKDLPSEGWAEMMDFWHCHKPDDGHDHNHANSTKGYAANSQLYLEPGVALVDPLDFVLLHEDCTNVEISDDFADALVCAHCKTTIGQTESTTRGYKLRKPKLSLSSDPDAYHANYQPEKWLACLLLCAMDSQGVRKLIVRGQNAKSNQALKLWIFAPDLKVSSSVRSSAEPVRVAKIMWQEIEAPEEDMSERLSGAALAEGELRLWQDEIVLLNQALVSGGEWIPEDSRQFQEWRVGLLERFTLEDIESR